MSDEYHQSGAQGTLVDPSVLEAVETGNYPPQSGDTTSSGGFASNERHPDTNPDAKELNTSGAGSGRDLGLVGSGEPEGVDRRGEDAYGSGIPAESTSDRTDNNTQSPAVAREETNPYGRGDSLESRGEAAERLGSAYDADQGSL